MSCTHDGLQYIMTIGGTAVYAGGYRDVSKNFESSEVDIDIYIAVGGPRVRDYAFKDIFSFSGNAEDMLTKTSMWSFEPENEFVIDWPDMQAPPFNIGFFEDLYEDLFHMESKSVAFYCHGGHGRTGTALAALAHLNKTNGKQDVVQWVRDNYCEKAVETASQIKWLKTNGVATDCDSSHEWKKPAKSEKETISYWGGLASKGEDDDIGVSDDIDTDVQKLFEEEANIQKYEDLEMDNISCLTCFDDGGSCFVCGHEGDD